jgi:hypothetical protein
MSPSALLVLSRLSSIIAPVVLSSDYMAMPPALSIVLSHHGGYLQSYASDRRARLQRCVELVSEFEVSVKLGGVLSPSALALGGVLMARILRFAPDLVPPAEGYEDSISELMMCRVGFDLCCLRDHLFGLCAEQRSADRAATPYRQAVSQSCALLAEYDEDEFAEVNAIIAYPSGDSAQDDRNMFLRLNILREKVLESMPLVLPTDWFEMRVSVCELHYAVEFAEKRRRLNDFLD